MQLLLIQFSLSDEESEEELLDEIDQSHIPDEAVSVLTKFTGTRRSKMSFKDNGV